MFPHLSQYLLNELVCGQVRPEFAHDIVDKPNLFRRCSVVDRHGL